MTNDRADLLAAAERAVQAWPIDPVQIELANLSENAVFRVDTATGRSYALRIHRPGYNSLAEMESELAWTSALRRAGIDVPTAVHTTAGPGYTAVTMPAWSEPRQVGLVEWLPGESLAATVEKTSDHSTVQRSFQQFGRVIARMHNQATAWTSPPGFQRRAWNADGLIGPNPLWGRFWELPQLITTQRDLLVRTRTAAWNTLNDYGADPATYGLIHADLHPYNVLVHNDRLTVIDFDDAGFGWHQYELAVALYNYRDAPNFTQIREALVAGYREERPLSNEALSLLPLFQMIRSLVVLGWIHGRPELNHASRLAPLIEATCVEADAFLAGTPR